jgi:hypothetical protein
MHAVCQSRLGASVAALGTARGARTLAPENDLKVKSLRLDTIVV